MKDLVEQLTNKGYPTIEELERALLRCESLPGAKAEIKLTHRYGDGVYTRTMVMPAGVVATGRRQRFKTVNILTRGKVIMYDKPGDKGVEVSAPCIFTSEAGNKKMGYFVEETEWTSIHLNPRNFTDLKVLEAFLYDDDIDEIRRTALIDRGDYALLLSELSMTEAQVRKQVENASDQIPMPFGSFKISIQESSIQGWGVSADLDIADGEVIAPARIGDKRTPVGRYTNHSITPNARMIRAGEDMYLIALTDIKGPIGKGKGEEITTDYRQTLKIVKEESSCQQ